MEKELELNNLRDTDIYETVKSEFPRICLPEPSDEIAFLIDILPEGDLPLVLPIKGEMFLVKSIRRHPDSLATILRVRPFDLQLSPTESITINTVEEVLEVFPWT